MRLQTPRHAGGAPAQAGLCRMPPSRRPAVESRARPSISTEVAPRLAVTRMPRDGMALAPTSGMPSNRAVSGTLPTVTSRMPMSPATRAKSVDRSAPRCMSETITISRRAGGLDSSHCDARAIPSPRFAAAIRWLYAALWSSATAASAAILSAPPSPDTRMLSLVSSTTARAVRAFHADRRDDVRRMGPAIAATASPTTATRSVISRMSEGRRMRTAAARDGCTKRRLGNWTRRA